MKKVGIIGGGFSGTMAAVHLIENATHAIEIIIVNDQENFNKGVAFNPYSKQFLLNVPTVKMSAFADHPEHFLNWVMSQKEYAQKDKNIVAHSFLPRHLYGQYLSEIWNTTIQSQKAKRHKIHVINDVVGDLELSHESILLTLKKGESICVDRCIIASGNLSPNNPNIINQSFYKSKNYYRNPWEKPSVTDLSSSWPVLIVGNGLTMVDTVLGLLENNFNHKIISISPNGFNILPHRHSGLKYDKFIAELDNDASLPEIVKLFNKHIKLIREFGLSAEPIIDSLRPQTQHIWQRLSVDEKKLFMSRLRHLWGVARHRIPLHIHDKIQQLRIDDRLIIYAGKLKDIHEDTDGIKVSFYNKKNKQDETICVSRVINCTGPETNLQRLEDNFLKKCLAKGVVCQDELKLGIEANPNTFRVKSKDGIEHQNLFTLGSNLKGVLWESTAVNELRSQASVLSKEVLSTIA